MYNNFECIKSRISVLKGIKTFLQKDKCIKLESEKCRSKKNRQNSLIVQDKFVFFETGVFTSMTWVVEYPYGYKVLMIFEIKEFRADKNWVKFFEK